MPCNMAMEWPDARIICVDLPNNMTSWWQKLYVATLWVIGISDRHTVPASGTLMENEHIVPVEMHWVGCRGRIVDDDADGGVRAEVFDIPFGLVGEVTLVCE